jgi:hypothetical protein
VSNLTPEELRVLEAARARINARHVEQEEWDHHERERAAGRRPNMSFANFKRGLAAAAAATDSARLNLGLALRPEIELDRRREAARAAIAAVPWELQQLTKKPTNFRRAATAQLAGVSATVAKYFEARPTVRDYARDVDQALAAPTAGPKSAMRNPASFVQQEDLDDLVPDGWGSSWPLETKRLARRAGIPPAAVALLNLLTWCSSCRAPLPGERRQLGAGLQASTKWIAKKLGVGPTWVKDLWNRLDPTSSYRRDVASTRVANVRRRRRGLPALPMPKKPTGTPYLKRFRQLKRYSLLAKRDGVEAAAWRDAGGRVRQWVDQRGVAYVTEAGRALLVRRANVDAKPSVRLVGGRVIDTSPRPALRPNGTLLELQALTEKLAHAKHKISMRLTRGAAQPVDNEARRSTAPPERRASSS